MIYFFDGDEEGDVDEEVVADTDEEATGEVE